MEEVLIILFLVSFVLMFFVYIIVLIFCNLNALTKRVSRLEIQTKCSCQGYYSVLMYQSITFVLKILLKLVLILKLVFILNCSERGDREGPMGQDPHAPPGRARSNTM